MLYVINLPFGNTFYALLKNNTPVYPCNGGRYMYMTSEIKPHHIYCKAI